MPLASTSAAALGYIPEATFGVTPTTGNYRRLRMTGESLDFSIEKTASAEINSTRTTSSMSPVSASATGGIQGELQYAEYDLLMAGTLQSAWAAYGTNGVGATFTADFTATTITATVAPTGGSAFTTLQRGQWFRVSAGVNANNGRLLRVSTVTAPTSTVITLDANTPAAVSSAVANVALQTSRLTHGSTQTSFSLERQLTDVGQFFNHRGMTPSKMDIGISSGSLSTINFDFMGKDVVRGAVTGLPGTPVASYAYGTQSGVSNTAACQIWLGTTPLTGTFAKSVSLSFDNALRQQDGICSLGAVGIGSGTINCTVDVEVYFSDGVLFDRFISNANSQIIFSSVDGAGNGYVFTLPAANISTHKINAGSKDTDVMASISFMGLNDDSNAVSALRKTLFVDRIGSAVPA